MLPTLADQERVFINKFVYRLGLERIQRGDTVVFWFPGDPSKSYIKRVIGLPGDVVELRDGVVHINGVALDESAYVYRDQPTLPTDTIARWQVPVDRLFVLGDHRGNSADSRVFGPIEKSDVIGRAWLRYWPFSTFGILPTPSHPELQPAAP